MDKSVIIIVFLCVSIPTAKSGLTGKFFWKPRLGLHLVPPLPTQKAIKPPTKDNIRDGYVIILEGYSIGVTAVSAAAGYQAATKIYKHLSLFHAPFYTSAYRWGMRHVNLIPYWLGGSGSRYPDTHKVWRRRYYYMDEFVPKWMRYLTPWITRSEWEREEKEYERYLRFAEPAFGKHFRYPTKKFRDFISEATVETVGSMFTVSASKNA